MFRLVEALSRDYLLHHRICPVEYGSAGEVVVAIDRDHRPAALEDVAVAYDRDVIVQEVDAAELDRLIERVSSEAERLVQLELTGTEASGSATDVTDLVNEPPVVRYVNLLIRDAHEARASDVHLETEAHGGAARFRIDGVLVPAAEPPPDLHQGVVSRIKLLADLDIAERRKPQDGRIRVRLEESELDIRVSTVPTQFGESVVLRLLDRGTRPVDLGELGLSKELQSRLAESVAKPHGMLLVTGPTGSGKTSTLYALLRTRERTTQKIITVEDPIEYQLGGVTQVPVRQEAGVSFRSALRSILRQDPDVIMLGEMRDEETAQLAVQAAMTGHLVLSTLHTNDAVGAVHRLLDLGVPPFLAGGTLEVVLAQRLVRRICLHCRESHTPSPEELEPLRAIIETSRDGIGAVSRGRGCGRCRGTGYAGRVGVFELLEVDEELRNAVSRGAPEGELRRLATRAGWRLMLHDGWRKVARSVTTVQEVVRVLQS